MVGLEYDALLKTKEFFQKYPLGDVESKNKGYAWIMRQTGNYRDYLRDINLESKTAYFQVYREDYFEMLVHSQPSGYPLSRRALSENWIPSTPLAEEK